MLKFLLITLILLVANSITFADKQATQPAEPTRKSKLTPEQREELKLRERLKKITEVTNFSEDQKLQLEVTIRKYLAEKTNWNSENQPKLDELSKQFTEARKTDDEERISEIQKQQNKIYRSKDVVYSKEITLASDIMTDAQKLRWEGWKLESDLLSYYKAVKFTKPQRTEITKICIDAGAKVLKTGENWHQINKIQRTLKQDTYDKIMTSDQRGAFESDKLEKAALSRYRLINLSSPQQEKSKKLALKFANQIAKTESRISKRGLHERFLLEVYEEILTSQQKKKVPKPKGTGNKPATK